ncbi:response regulator transcription factor [Parvibaculum sp.]|uniref:helix-turn-helix transcriptional regulator n=1 Tax=Parvibaculum sp. TaxID=2024848 RepID=UPI00391D4F92
MAARRAKARAEKPTALADPAALQDVSVELLGAGGLGSAEAALGRLAGLIAMPRAIWTPDAASPLHDAAAESFMRRQGWPAEIVSAMWEGGVPLRMPLNIRCRFEHLPFAISLYDEHRKHRAPYSGEQKRVAVMMRAEGFNSVVVVPVRLPYARIAMLGFAGPQVLEEAKEIAAWAAPHLLAAGHAFTALHERLARRPPAPEAHRTALTPREWDCLSLAAQGFREAEIAAENGIKPTTVRYHMDNIVAKLGARSRAHAVAVAAQLGLVRTA